MPRPKKFPMLQHLAIESIARNIVKHGVLMQRNRSDGYIFLSYRSLKYLFTNHLLRAFFGLCSRDQESGDEEFENFFSFLFLQGAPGKAEMWPCLELLFNEFTTRAHLPSSTVVRCQVSNEIASYIASQCQALKFSNESFCYLVGRHFVERVHEFRYLHDINLGYIHNTNILRRIFQACPLVRNLTADCGGRFVNCDSSDKFLLSLCKYCSENEEFVFCPENGACSEAGKQLRSLRIMLYGDTGPGIACALQHLPHLRRFTELPSCDMRSAVRMYSLEVVKGIVMLQEAAVRSGKPLVILELAEIFFSSNLNMKDVSTLHSSCPNMEAVQLCMPFTPLDIYKTKLLKNVKELYFYWTLNDDLNSTELRHFLQKRGKQITATGFIFVSCEINLAAVNEVLKACPNLKKIMFWSFMPSLRNVDQIPHPPASVSCLEEICIQPFDKFPELSRHYFYELLAQATNVRSLDIASDLAERELVDAMSVNDFCSLEVLCIRSADLSRIPLQRLLNARNNLKTVQLRNCRNLEPFVAEFRDIARKNNYDVNFEQISAYFKYGERNDLGYGQS